jgi:lipoate-protein ligase A
MPESWRLIRTGHMDAAWNMAIDEAIMKFAPILGRPTLRFYGWENTAITIGYFQDYDKEFDEAICRSMGINIIRRLTGGRAVLHDVEVTYSIVIPEGKSAVTGSVLETYRKISEGFVIGLRKMGLEVEVATPKNNVKEISEGTAACFDAPSWYEVTVNGKKIIGSAQVRKQGVLLQQGSIPLEMDVEKLFTVLKFADIESKQRAKMLFQQKAASLREVLGQRVSFLQVCEAIKEGMREALAIDFCEEELSEQEYKAAERIVEERYSQLEWNKCRGSLKDQYLA